MKAAFHRNVPRRQFSFVLPPFLWIYTSLIRALLPVIAEPNFCAIILFRSVSSFHNLTGSDTLLPLSTFDVEISPKLNLTCTTLR